MESKKKKIDDPEELQQPFSKQDLFCVYFILCHMPLCLVTCGWHKHEALQDLNSYL